MGVITQQAIVGSLAVATCVTTGWLVYSRRITFRHDSRPYVRLFVSTSNPLFQLVKPSSTKREFKTGAVSGGLQLDTSQYPHVKRDIENGEYTLCGEKIQDPYLWLENPDSEETQQFVEVQNIVTQEVLARCESRDNFKNLMTKLYDFPRYGCPFKRGNRYYYFYNQGLQAQDVLFSQASLTDQPYVVIDPNKLSQDGTVSMSGTSFSEDGELMAYQLSTGGSDWKIIKILQVAESGAVKHLEDELSYVKFSSIEWTKDNKGFFYTRYDPPVNNSGNGGLGTETAANTCQQVWYHYVGQPQEKDIKLWQDKEHPLWMQGIEVTDDNRYLLIYIMEGCKPAELLYFVDMQQLQQSQDTGGVDWRAYSIEGLEVTTKLPYKVIIDNFEGQFSYVANEGSTIYFKTNLNAPRYRVVKTQLDSSTQEYRFVDVIQQHDKDVLKWVCALKGDVLVACYLKNVVSQLELRKLTTGEIIQKYDMPYLGSVAGFSGDRKSTEFFFKFSGFTEPGQIYRVDASEAPNCKLYLLRSTKLEGYDSSQLTTKQVFVSSYDGTKIPMFIVHRNDLVLDGANPTMLYGYGGFNISLNPSFSVSRISFILGYNGVYAIANLRGGGEYGTEWRDAGSVLNKQNVFDDFQSCAEYLIKNKYCRADKLTIKGGSNGGLLVAACANQRPDLYACVLGQVGVLDMLRFHKFTIGAAWVSDFGDPDKKEDFEYLKKYSPLHNVKVPQDEPRQYPAVMLTTADHDDRVVPLHSFKFIAQLQHVMSTDEKSQQKNPLVLRVDVKAGHGGGKPTDMVIQEEADTTGFAAKCMNAKWVYNQ
eukprot:TRINITY_DN10949_c0_g2_i1.p1 TRINITY_DN10949_c0_g2~~TRINITY_DN10949_c0_g2_i1.p1  ORF type:complete len:816 (+),score=84.31 TRINITY_DN10949_c0_g2_i1:157-2604(+)